MKIILMILLSTCLSLGNSEYPRFKRKGVSQSGPPRLPPSPQFGKKWGKPPQKMAPPYGQNWPYKTPQPPLRGNRAPKPQMQVFNMHLGHMQHPMHNAPKYQQFPQKNQDFFKMPFQQHKISNNQLIQFPQENKIVPKIIHKQEKPSFISSPSIPTAIEHDYHIQANSIPMNINTIKQIGEKGPIHTIPAPNLTPADKPSNVELRNPLHYHQQQEIRYQQSQYLNEQPQMSHQYQVTERNEQTPKQLYRDQINSQPHFNQPQVTQQLDQFGNQHNQAYYKENNPGITLQETGNHGINIGFAQPQAEQAAQDALFSSTKQYQVVPEQSLYTQAIQSSYEQQQPQVLREFVQPESEYLQQHSQENFQGANDKSLNVEPEYHSFNYDEQAHQTQAKSGLVTATYSLGPQEEIVKGQNVNSRSSVDPLTQTQIVQSYFNTRSGNNGEPDAKPSATGYIEKEVKNNKSFYSSLPNKEAADRLAKLQAAGRINSSLMQIGKKNFNQKEKGNNLSAVYAQNDNSSDDKDHNIKEQSVEYEDYDDEGANSDEETGFGQKNKFQS